MQSLLAPQHPAVSLPTDEAPFCRNADDQQVGKLPALLRLLADMKKVMLQVQEGRCTAEAASLAYAEEFDARRWVGWCACLW